MQLTVDFNVYCLYYFTSAAIDYFFHHYFCIDLVDPKYAEASVVLTLLTALVYCIVLP